MGQWAVGYSELMNRRKIGTSFVKWEDPMLRYFLVVMAALLLPVLALAQCLTTLAPNPPFVPPAPYPPSAPNGTFWYGTEALWTAVDVDGKWSMRNNVLNGKGYRTKLVFWRRGFDSRTEPEPKLIVTGKRLDGDAGNTPGMMTLVDIPTAGCWEVTGHYGGHTLTFVVSVVP
jgi:hypothetical protein